MHLGKKPIVNDCTGVGGLKINVEDNWMKLLFITFKCSQIDFSLLVSPGSNTSRLCTGAKGHTGSTTQLTTGAGDTQLLLASSSWRLASLWRSQLGSGILVCWQFWRDPRPGVLGTPPWPVKGGRWLWVARESGLFRGGQDCILSASYSIICLVDIPVPSLSIFDVTVIRCRYIHR